MFAECIPSGTRRTSSLPSAATKTLAKKNTRQIGRFAECQKNTRQRGGLPSVKKITWQRNKIFFLEKKKKKKNIFFCRVLRSRTLDKKKEKKKMEKKLCRVPHLEHSANKTNSYLTESPATPTPRPHPFSLLPAPSAPSPPAGAASLPSSPGRPLPLRPPQKSSNAPIVLRDSSRVSLCDFRATVL